MSDILIKGMEMPTDYPLWVVVSADGTVQYNYFNEWKTAEEKAVSVPPHGRLIDADALNYTMLYKENWMRGTGVEAPAVWKKDIDAAPTIIEAEGRDT